jgi:anti-sigma factor RsiW
MMHEAFDELMSLKLDGLIDDVDERRLEEHLGECESCARSWVMLKQVDGVLRNSASEPLPVPYSFHSKVMAQIAAPAPQRQTQTAGSSPLFLPNISTGRLGETPSLQSVGVPALAAASVTGGLASPPAHTRRLLSAPTTGLNDTLDWQRQVVGYLRNAAAIILALAGMSALFLALAMSGVIRLEGPIGEGVSTLRTVFEAVGAWFQSLFTTSGSTLIAASALIAGLLLLVGWQVVASYQRAAVEGRGHTGALTGALNTGPLEVAA